MTQYRKHRIMWLCNCHLIDRESGGSGSWLGAMARGLLDSGAVELGVVAPGPVDVFTRKDYRDVRQWLLPSNVRLGSNGLPAASVVQSIVAAVAEFAPDLVHTWGTEEFRGLLVARKLLPYPALLEMQGVKGEIAKMYCGGLTLREGLCCIGIKEVYHRRTMWTNRRDFARWGRFEREIIRGHCFVAVQSLWVAAHVKAINPAARLFPMDLALRDPFYDDQGWSPSGNRTVFCIAASHPPYKGLHVAIRSLALLRERLPGARLRIAGAHQRVRWRQDGYMVWINNLVRRLGLSDAVEWLGPLNAGQIVSELKNAAAVVIPTFIENCCTAMQETMYIGTPLVVSHVGGLPSLAKDEESALFFPPGDEAVCAIQLERLLKEPELALRLSRGARATAAARNRPDLIVPRQLRIYEEIIEQPEVER